MTAKALAALQRPFIVDLDLAARVTAIEAELRAIKSAGDIRVIALPDEDKPRSNDRVLVDADDLGTRGATIEALTGDIQAAADQALGDAAIATKASPTVAALRLITTSASAGDIWQTAGYTTKGDGGGAQYFLDASDTTSADNGGSIIVDAVGRRWKLMLGVNGANPRHFGAKGNGTGDDTAAIQAAIDYGRSVFIPAGTYRLNSPLQLRNGLTVQGEDWQKVCLECWHSQSVFQNTGETMQNNILLQHMQIMCRVAALAAIDFTDVVYSRVNHVHITAQSGAQAFRYGVRMTSTSTAAGGCWGNCIQNCLIFCHHATSGAAIFGNSGAAANVWFGPNSLRVENCRLLGGIDAASTTDAGVDVDDTNGVEISNNVFEGFLATGVRARIGSTLGVISGNRFENLGGGAGQRAIVLEGINNKVDGNNYHVISGTPFFIAAGNWFLEAQYPTGVNGVASDWIMQKGKADMAILPAWSRKSVVATTTGGEKIGFVALSNDGTRNTFFGFELDDAGSKANLFTSGQGAVHPIAIKIGSFEAMRFASDYLALGTGLDIFCHDLSLFRRIEFGFSDSAGTGYRVLRIKN